MVGISLLVPYLTERATQNANDYGYDVSFGGVGSVGNAFSGQEGWTQLFPEMFASDDFGFCSQSATFTQKKDTIIRPPPFRISSPLESIAKSIFPWANDDGYPPTQEATIRIIRASESFFRPLYKQIPIGSDTIVSVVIDISDFWDTIYEIQRICRFDTDIYDKSIGALVHFNTSANIVKDDYARMNAEPQAEFVNANIRHHDKSLVIDFTFDISEFLTHVQRDDDIDLVEVIGDWHLQNPRSSTPATSEESQNTEWAS